MHVHTCIKCTDVIVGTDLFYGQLVVRRPRVSYVSVTTIIVTITWITRRTVMLSNVFRLFDALKREFRKKYSNCAYIYTAISVHSVDVESSNVFYLSPPPPRGWEILTRHRLRGTRNRATYRNCIDIYIPTFFFFY